MTPARIGLVGCGRLAELGYVPALELVDHAALVAVADPDASRRAAVVSAAADAPSAHTGIAELLADADVDAVVLATPAAAHVADAETAVAAGVPVLVEKPPAPDLAGAVRLAALGPMVRVGFNRRFDAGARSVRAAIPARGDLDLDLAIRYRRSSWRAHTVRDDVVDDLVPHLADWARWLAGTEVTDVAARVLTRDEVELELGLSRGRATLRAAADGFHAEHIVARAGEGAELASVRIGGRVAAVLGRLPGRRGPHPLTASLAAQLDQFVASARGHPALDLGRPADGVAVMAVVEAARASAALGGTCVAIDDTLESRPC